MQCIRIEYEKKSEGRFSPVLDPLAVCKSPRVTIDGVEDYNKLDGKTIYRCFHKDSFYEGVHRLTVERKLRPSSLPDLSQLGGSNISASKGIGSESTKNNTRWNLPELIKCKAISNSCDILNRVRSKTTEEPSSAGTITPPSTSFSEFATQPSTDTSPKSTPKKRKCNACLQMEYLSTLYGGAAKPITNGACECEDTTPRIEITCHCNQPINKCKCKLIEPQQVGPTWNKARDILPALNLRGSRVDTRNFCYRIENPKALIEKAIVERRGYSHLGGKKTARRHTVHPSIPTSDDYKPVSPMTAESSLDFKTVFFDLAASVPTDD